MIQGFLRAKNVSQKDLIEKDTDKGKFYFIKIEPKNILVEELLQSMIPKALNSISWPENSLDNKIRYVHFLITFVYYYY